jgi:hypothetical protein
MRPGELTMKLRGVVVLLAMYFLAGAAYANCRGDGVAPPTTTKRFTTDVDNENNDGTGSPDNDMDVYVYATYGISPIEFNIDIPVTLNGRDAFLTICAWDVDSSGGEVIPVYLNGIDLGELRGENRRKRRTDFVIPAGVLQQGKNLVQVLPDPSDHWGVMVLFGFVQFASPVTPIEVGDDDQD